MGSRKYSRSQTTPASQNNWGCMGPQHFLLRVRPDWVAKGFTQSGLENLQGWRLHSLTGPLLHCQIVLVEKKVSPYLQSELVPLNLFHYMFTISNPPVMHKCEHPGSAFLIASLKFTGGLLLDAAPEKASLFPTKSAHLASSLAVLQPSTILMVTDKLAPFHLHFSHYRGKRMRQKLVAVITLKALNIEQQSFSSPYWLQYRL